LTPEITRFGYGPLSMILLVVLVAYDRVLAAILLAVAMAASNHITPMVAGFAGVAFYLIVYYKGNILRLLVEKRRFMLAFFLVPVAVSVALQQTISTFSRFQTLNDDYVRSYIVDQSTQMLRESKFLGIGYMNFYAWSGIDTGYAGESRTGSEILGFNLHNSYMTWALEGGLMVSVIVLVILWLTMGRLKAVLAADRQLGAVLMSWFIVFGIFALFHQVHMSIQFWGAIGLVWGIHAKQVYQRRKLRYGVVSHEQNVSVMSPT
jgi:hypothetical protein